MAGPKLPGFSLLFPRNREERGRQLSFCSNSSTTEARWAATRRSMSATDQGRLAVAVRYWNQGGICAHFRCSRLDAVSRGPGQIYVPRLYGNLNYI
jgi:hypothetical protein